MRKCMAYSENRMYFSITKDTRIEGYLSWIAKNSPTRTEGNEEGRLTEWDPIQPLLSTVSSIISQSFALSLVNFFAWHKIWKVLLSYSAKDEFERKEHTIEFLINVIQSVPGLGIWMGKHHWQRPLFFSHHRMISKNFL